MNPVGKIVKLLLALTVAGVVALGLQGCEKQNTAAPQAPAAAAPSPAAAPTAPPPPAAAEQKDAEGRRVVEIKVTNEGYVPSPVTLKQGEPVTVKVTRTTDATCATEFILDEHKINEKLPLNETITVQFTPQKSGELKYGCAMGKMMSGRFVIQ